MHDIFEGICEYDLGLVINYFIVTAKFFSLDTINERIESLFYGDEIGNKPRPLKKAQILEKFIKMSAAESLCFMIFVQLIPLTMAMGRNILLNVGFKNMNFVKINNINSVESGAKFRSNPLSTERQATDCVYCKQNELVF
ncbi:Protein of unknown function [Cotesia congregata]|uniref:Uncharacterized protein n=1 Tax=Cotesia congregata TaxID=51543 RepID=A0A8J2HFN5_COTCN|nr:Protein of unknown function [Cotesia congregata]